MSESAGFVTIKDLTGATIATEDDDLIIQQGEETKRINLKTLGDLLVFLDKIEQVKTSTENGGINEIKATLSDGSTATFTTQNGHGIQKIEQTVKSDVSSGTNVITATLSDGQKSNFEIKNGDQGEKGDTGAALIDVVQKETSAVSGGKNVISFKLNDGSYKDVEVYNGAKGETGEVSQEVLNQTVNEAIAGVVANAPSDFDTLKEMSDWISEHEDDATAMNSAILENKNQIETLSKNIGLTKSKEIDLSTKSVSNFYPAIITGRSATAFKEVMITSEGGWGSIAYNQNRIHFTISTDGWRDTLPSLFIEEYTCYDSKEITIGCIGYGDKDSPNACVWLRGGKKYTVYTVDCDVTCNGEDVIEPAIDSTFSKFTVGPNYYGETNSNVAILFTPQTTTTNGLYSNRAITAPEFMGTASQAIADGSGNNIENTYVTKNNVQNYSTTPQKIGTWIDGKDVYRVVIENELEGNIVGHLAGTVESGAKIISANGQITDVMEATSFLPCYHPSYNIGLTIEGNSIYFNGWSNTSFTNVKLVVEYTK